MSAPVQLRPRPAAGDGLDPLPRSVEDQVERGPVARSMVAAIRGYQLLRSGRPTGCRFLPTCSDYAVQAIEAHGTVRGARLTLGRLTALYPLGWTWRRSRA